ncbi:isochorismate synthase [Saccharomonospora amisosensis]|uniref:isochorismate synthase n=1 Tax=Saccharomonospora amisosensis TaxID=1128677 RepID=A0A7X5ULS1_9PSEU|nr:isochorismate synthase [Saccharomonospora amisosensis]NIJ10367.1 isochorismate synthase [Saccharomonospora amisosensis]
MADSSAEGTTAEASVRLLEDYTARDFFLATENATLLGSGVAAALTDTDEVRLSQRVATALQDGLAPIAVGALPFDSAEGTPGRIVLPRRTRLAGPMHPAVDTLPRRQVSPPANAHPVPEPRRHADAVARAVVALRERGLRKVVLARALDVEFTDGVSAEAILHNLVKDNPGGYTFAAGLPGGRTLVGSSPELLLSRQGDRVVSLPHAGSLPRSADPVADTENGKALLSSRKDHIEHAVLAEAVVETLRPFCRKLDVPEMPELVSTPTMWHLRTKITGELVDRDVTALRLAAALHPTPAICGTPTGLARELVTELEPFERGYYAGTVGWVNAEGDGEWAVSIRCAEIGNSALRLYAGGGIVPESDPWAELEETSAKFATLLTAMGLPREWLAEL